MGLYKERIRAEMGCTQLVDFGTTSSPQDHNIYNSIKTELTVVIWAIWLYAGCMAVYGSKNPSHQRQHGWINLLFTMCGFVEPVGYRGEFDPHPAHSGFAGQHVAMPRHLFSLRHLPSPLATLARCQRTSPNEEQPHLRVELRNGCIRKNRQF